MPTPYTSYHDLIKTGDRCPGATKRWRYLDDGRIEVEGEGVQTTTFPKDVIRWRHEIETAAAKYQVPPAYIAAIMAHETQGKSVCLSAATFGVCSAPCKCVQNEGAGVMAMVPTTATGLAGRKVTSQELLDNPALAIDLGTKYIRSRMDAHQTDDFMYAAVAYNANTVRCGRGGVFVPSGAGWPKQSCPVTGWGVVFGCVFSSKNYASKTCAPSSGGPQPYICSTNYPDSAWRLYNSALAAGFAGQAPLEPPLARAGTLTGLGLIAAGAIFAFGITEYVLSTPGGRRAVDRVVRW